MSEKKDTKSVITLTEEQYNEISDRALDKYWTRQEQKEVHEDRLKEDNKKRILAALREPFDEETISWKPQIVRNGKAMGIAYADPRAYFDRLSEVCGATGWSVRFEPTVAVFNAGNKGSDKHAGKIVVVATVLIEELEHSHSSTGESWLEDENAITGAEAQAMKRACVPFGLGEYLYHLPKFWAPYDDVKKQFIEDPKLPEWALPTRKCEGCDKVITPYKTDKTEMSVTAIIAKSKREYDGQFCAACMIEKKKAKDTELTRSV